MFRDIITFLSPRATHMRGGKGFSGRGASSGGCDRQSPKGMGGQCKEKTPHGGKEAPPHPGARSREGEGGDIQFSSHDTSTQEDFLCPTKN